MRDGSGSYDEGAAIDGWKRTLDFLGAHLGRSRGPNGG
jgi:dienelactone hydrolase